MTNEEKNMIRRLRFAGEKYAQIAEQLHLPEGTVKSFCSRNQLKMTDVKQTGSMSGSCKQCGKPLHHTSKKKPKQFCSDQCRMKWWNGNRDKVSKKNAKKLVCPACGRKFESYGASRKYCSHACYIADRFGKRRAEHCKRAVSP